LKKLAIEGGEKLLMTEQKEKAAPNEVAEKTESKCSKCGNERIKENYNFCSACGNQLKENPIIIDYLPQRQRA